MGYLAKISDFDEILSSVHGLNLAIPEQAKAVIKPWSEREDTTVYADSGVDDQVSCVSGERFTLINDDFSADDHTCALRTERAR